MPDETLLGFDFGEKKLGIAIGNTLTRQARPLEIIFSETRAARFGRIAELLQEWQPQRVVVGLSLASDGGEQPATARCRRFANQLHGRFGLQVELVDERGSSMEAQQLLGTNAPDDAVAAAVILQRYLDALPSAGASGSRV
ncbi:Holliday junction resolvase RuvX [Bordetella genomosp. 13]|uniref:Putative pre-16S rRNA nuclease n=1 Tax=Bordetella genomosp. 13 TaxID=463040 RepID=A0A1W6ZH39_9BORD|nr:Holliday junction resolvase RuvX [Bordetella genomosp. 13]ARP96631.1 Holliday junction resolvase RuvX [Bordetella genomosp. 13]